jgi:hypothetical protein
MIRAAGRRGRRRRSAGDQIGMEMEIRWWRRPAGPFPSKRHQKCCATSPPLTSRTHDVLIPIHPPTTPAPVSSRRRDSRNLLGSLAATLLSTPPRRHDISHKMVAAAAAAATATAAALLAPGLKLCAGRARVSSPSGLPLRRVTAMASAPNSSFRPEEARSPPALELPIPPLSKVTPFRFGFLRACLLAQVGGLIWPRAEFFFFCDRSSRWRCANSR